MPPFRDILNLVYLYFLVRGIYTSQRRWLSCGYAALGFVAFIVLYVIIVGIITSVTPMSLAATNKVLGAAGYVALFASVIGAYIPPRRPA